MLSQATDQTQRRTTEEDPRLEEIKRLARAAKEGHADDSMEGFNRFKNKMLTERLDLTLFLVRDAVDRALWAEWKRLEWGSAGVQMQANARAERAAHPADPMDEATKKLRLQRKRAGQAAFAKTSILLSFQVEGRALGFCSRGELVKKAATNETDARFLRAVAALLPDDSAVVRDHVTDKEAEEAFRYARAAA